MKKNLLTSLLLLSFIICFSQATLVKDIMSGVQDGININSELFKYNDKILFKSFGGELSFSDGTNSGTSWINIGQGSASPEGFTLNSVTNEVYFSARGPATPSNSYNTELWKTNGTLAGTMLAHDFTPQAGWSSMPEDICEMDGVMYCSTQLIGTGDQIGYTDPINSFSGVIQADPGTNTYPKDLFAHNGLLYFRGNGSTWFRELCVSDGTQSGTGLLKELNISGWGDPEDFFVFNNKVYFTAENGTNGRELWATNGTSAGTYMVTDINAGANSSNPSNFQVFGNKLFFSATNDSTGTELYYMLTNENVILYRDINPGPASSNPSNITPYNGYIYFNADNGTNGEELWRSDGSIFGISLFKDINTTGSSSPKSFEKYNGNLYFAADDGANGEELWITDGTTAGTVMIADINPGAGSSVPRFLVDVDGELLFHADDGSVGRELWKYVDPALSTNEFELNNTIKLQPNPTQDYFTISTQLNIQDVTIFDINGKMVKKFYGLLDQYNIENLTAGLYFVNVLTDNRKETIKLMKL